MKYSKVHFRSSYINGDGSVRKAGDELIDGLKSLSTIVQEQVHSIEHSLSQIDNYQQVSFNNRVINFQHFDMFLITNYITGNSAITFSNRPPRTTVTSSPKSIISISRKRQSHPRTKCK